MLPEESYLIAWIIYLLSAGGLIATTRKLSLAFNSKDARRLMMVLVGIFILMPWYVSEGQTHLAPAFLVTLLDAITESPQQASRAGVPLLLGLIAGVLITALTGWILKLLTPSEPNPES